MHGTRTLLQRGWKGLRRSLRPLAGRAGLLDGAENQPPDPAGPEEAPESLAGRLRISLGPAADPGEPAMGLPGAATPPSPATFVHRHVWVRGRDYSGMEDNDIRGFLDGRVVHPWNQPSQIHVRMGRFWRGPNLGEWEVFRVLQRWNGIRLPPGARVVRASLVLAVERGVDPGQGPDREMEILLYNVRKDWRPGEGGVERNNTSAAAPGEVWWNEATRGGTRWGLPGAGFASDTHPDADTPAMPLAVGRSRPGQTTVSFNSSRLARYVEERSREGEPLLFLLKLSDYLEDSAGTLLNFYSANHGDDRNTIRRPRLVLDWVPGEASRTIEHDILLEHGRSLVLPRMALPGPGPQILAVSYHPGESREEPTIRVRTGQTEPGSEWEALAGPEVVEGEWLEVRLEAARDPVILGQPFTARLRDTWVRTGPPEDQEVPWSFLAPSGEEYRVLAEFQGDFTWEVSFRPDQVGRWRYSWRQDFLPEPYRSADGSFDVVPGDAAATLQALQHLADTLEGSDMGSWRRRMAAFGVLFQRLQRGLLRHQTPEEFDLDAEDPGGVGLELDRTRRLFSGRPGPQDSRLDPEGGDRPESE